MWSKSQVQRSAVHTESCSLSAVARNSGIQSLYEYREKATTGRRAAAFGDVQALAPKQERKRAKPDPAELVPTRRSARERKEVFYGDVPHTLPSAALIMTSIETLGERAAKGLPWPTLAQLVRPSLLDAPCVLYSGIRTDTSEQHVHRNKPKV